MDRIRLVLNGFDSHFTTELVQLWDFLNRRKIIFFTEVVEFEVIWLINAYSIIESHSGLLLIIVCFQTKFWSSVQSRGLLPIALLADLNVVILIFQFSISKGPLSLGSAWNCLENWPPKVIVWAIEVIFWGECTIILNATSNFVNFKRVRASERPTKHQDKVSHKSSEA